MKFRLTNQLTPAPVGQNVSNWMVTTKLGEGAFGAVYKVQKDGQVCAIKTESLNSGQAGALLQVEVNVLQELAKAGKPNFCKIHDSGRVEGQFVYVVMTLIGKSLHDLRKSYACQHFSLSTALRAGAQCLQAIKGLHEVGYLHRDIKPGNYSIGLPETNEQRVIFLLDFGMCRKFVNEAGNIRRPRRGAAFRGTIRYAPLVCHDRDECARKDDVESWFYQQLEITKAAIPWRTLSDMHQIGLCKRELRNSAAKRTEMCSGMPAEFETIFNHITALQYYDTPNYDWIILTLRQALHNAGYSMSDAFDWECGGPEAFEAGRAKAGKPMLVTTPMSQASGSDSGRTTDDRPNRRPFSRGRGARSHHGNSKFTPYRPPI